MPKRIELPPEVINGLDPAFKGGKNIRLYPYSSSKKFVFSRPTCDHRTYCTIKSFHNKLRPSRECWQCTGKTNSVCEVLLRKAVKGVFEGEVFTVEDRVVDGFPGAVDVFVPRYSLIIQFDGVHHFEKGHHQTSVAQQKEIDEDLNCLAWKQGFRVFRIHYLDATTQEAMTSLVFYAKNVCHTYPGRNFVYWSQSFCKPHILGCELVEL